MICLGIESSAHTLGIGLAWDFRILANERAMYKPKFKGIHPRKAADYLAREFPNVFENAVSKAEIQPTEIDLIAFTQGPGLPVCLKVGVVAAKMLSQLLNKPIIGVNHAVAHVEVTKVLCRCRDPLVVYVSGGNTQILVLEGRKYRVLGETLDIGLGNLLDSFGRAIGLEYAHGSVIEELASKGEYIQLPYTVKGMNLVFTGLLTEAQKLAKKERKEDLCYSLQETAFAMLVEASERALALTKKKELILCGGVAQNGRLQGMYKEMVKKHETRFSVAKNEYNADNGAMIALTGNLMYKAGVRIKLDEANAIQKYRIDEVEVTW
jgi:N6-L-threonylcarbamoyladenine synthase